MNDLSEKINLIWKEKNNLHKKKQSSKKIIMEVINKLNTGNLRVATKNNKKWIVNEWIKKAILLYFMINHNKCSTQHPDSFDKIPLKFKKWNTEDFKESRLRIVPGSIVRYGSHLGKNCIIMPSFINIGAFIDEGTMVDTWATIGSCVQIGKNCHISGGTGLGGVLEPLQSNPVIIEDNCFIGARSEIVEGVIVQEGSVIGMGVFISPSTPIISRKTGKINFNKIPPYSVVISGTLPKKIFQNTFTSQQLQCAVIIKTVDHKTKLKTSLNELLRY